MASPFYARYIPPAKPLVTVNSDNSKQDVTVSNGTKRKRDTGGVPVQAISRSTPSFPSESSGAHAESQLECAALESAARKKKKKKKKKKKPTVEEASKDAVQEPEPDLSDGGDGAPKKQKRKRPAVESSELKTSNDDQVSVDEAVVEEDSRHRKIRAKFEKSARISAKLAKKSEESHPKEDQEGPEEALETHGLVPLPQPEQLPDEDPNIGISALPEWLAKPMVISPETRVPFKDLPLGCSTIASLESKGFAEAFAIQTGVLPLLLPGGQEYRGDLCISAATGSGKTLAYVLPMVEALRGKPVTRLRGLIVVPTRELVTQVRDTLQLCISRTNLRIGTAVGNKTLKEEQQLLMTKGQKYDPEGYQAAQLKKFDGNKDVMDWSNDWGLADDDSDCPVDFVIDYTSSVDILVCTPGRLVDHIRSTKGFTLEHVQWLVIDEADRLLDESFQQWIDVMVPALQAQSKSVSRIGKLVESFRLWGGREVQKVILSATMTKDISKLMALQLRKPKLVVLGNSHVKKLADELSESAISLVTNELADFELPATLEEIVVPIRKVEEKPLYLLKLLFAIDIMKEPPHNRKELMPKAGPDYYPNHSDSTSSDDSDLEISSSGSETPGPESESDSDASSFKSFRNDLQLPPGTEASSSAYGVLIFTNNNENALRLARLLSLLRPSWASRIGSLTKSTATSTGRRTLAAFRNRKLSILVATDRASRGLDIRDLAQVVNYDMPTSVTSYVHRVGRTARARKKGVATTLVAHHEARWFWNEIARSGKVRRAGKVVKADDAGRSFRKEDRESYERALRKLGEEARGETT